MSKHPNTIMFQAIVTKFVGPSNTKGSRIIAKCDARKIVVGYDHSKSPEENHTAAAEELKGRLGWPEKLQGGGLPGENGYCFVLIPA